MNDSSSIISRIIYTVLDKIKTIVGNFNWLNKPKEINAIYYEDFIELPQQLLPKGAICQFCQRPLSRENLGGWIKHEGKLVLFCNEVHDTTQESALEGDR